MKQLLAFILPLSAKWKQCHPPSFYHHLGTLSLCLSAQSHCTTIKQLERCELKLNGMFFSICTWVYDIILSS